MRMSHQRRDSDETLLCMDRSSPKGPQREAGRGDHSPYQIRDLEFWDHGLIQDYGPRGHEDQSMLLTFENDFFGVRRPPVAPVSVRRG